jgi:hypothetical protein
MIQDYFAQVEQVLQAFPNISSYTLKKKFYSNEQGYISGSITFKSGTHLDFTEVKDSKVASKNKYRYHYMGKNPSTSFRYDNAPHHRDVPTFPHHKHTGSSVQQSTEPTLHDVLLEIAKIERENL